MDNARFQRVAEEGKDKLTALMSPFATAFGGGAVFYNAYYHGQEVVVLGYQRPAEGGGTTTKPVAIMVDEEVFNALRVDDERSRVDGEGNEAPKKVL